MLQHALALAAKGFEIFPKAKSRNAVGMSDRRVRDAARKRYESAKRAVLP